MHLSHIINFLSNLTRCHAWFSFFLFFNLTKNRQQFLLSLLVRLKSSPNNYGKLIKFVNYLPCSLVSFTSLIPDLAHIQNLKYQMHGRKIVTSEIRRRVQSKTTIEFFLILWFLFFYDFYHHPPNSFMRAFWRLGNTWPTFPYCIVWKLLLQMPKNSPLPAAPSGSQVPAEQFDMVFHCQLAHGSATKQIRDFTNVKQLYESIAKAFSIATSDVSVTDIFLVYMYAHTNHIQRNHMYTCCC